MLMQALAARRMKVIRRVLVFAATSFVCANLSFAQSKADAARGAAKAEACVACHGSPKAAPPAGMPALGGQQPEFTVLQLILIREGLRDVPEMRGMLKGFSDPDLGDVAAYFAGQALPPQTTRCDPKLVARGAELAKARGCGSCHFGNFLGQNQIPRIANQREDYLVMSLKAYRDNKRSGIDTSMNNAMYQVSDDEIRALAHFLAHHE
jgi:cytochrome c553